MEIKPIRAQPGFKRPTWGPEAGPYPRIGAVVVTTNLIWDVMWPIVQEIKEEGRGYDEY